MLQTPTHSHLLSTNFYPSSLLPIHHHHLSNSVCLPHRTIPLSSVSAAPRSRANSWIARAGEESTSNSSASPEEEGPIELPFSAPSVFATNDDPTPLQIATSVLLTGSIAVFLFRSVRRRAKRAKELRFRSTGAKKTLKEEALENLKAFGTATIEPSKSSKQETSAVQAFLGGLTAGVIALILYKFTLTIEDGLNRQTLSDSFSVRQITITIRTIINGICYLATFVFGLNSLGLLLYSGQLALNSFSDDDESSRKESKGQPSPTETPTEGTEVSGGGQGDLKSDEKR